MDKATYCELPNNKSFTHKMKINKQTKQDKFKSENNNKDNVSTNNKAKLEADYFGTGPNMETDRATSVKTMIKIHNKFKNMFVNIGYFKMHLVAQSQRKHKNV